MDAALIKSFAILMGYSEDAIGTLRPRVLAAVPYEDFKKVVQEWVITTESAMEPAGLYVKSLAMQTEAVRLHGAMLPTLALSGPEARAEAEAVKTSTAELHKIKFSNIIDLSDETEAAGATPSQIRVWYENDRALTHGDPSRTMTRRRTRSRPCT